MMRLAAGAVGIAALAIGAWLRVSRTQEAFLYGDERFGLLRARLPYAEIVSTFDFGASGMATPLLQRVFMDLLGETLLAFRLPALLPGLALLLLVPWVGRRLVGSSAALIAGVGVALSPLLLFYAHFARAYALIVAFALVLVAALERILAAQDDEPRAAYAVTVVSIVVLLYAHLSALLLIAPVTFAAGLWIVFRGPHRKRLLGFGGVLAVAGLLALLTYVPPWEAMAKFMGQKLGGEPILGDQPPSFRWLDVLSLLGGSPVAGAVLLLSAVIAVPMLRRGSPGLLLVVAAALGPPLLLILAEPRNLVYGYARYVLGALPFALMILAWGLVETGRRLGRHGPAVAVVVGCGLVLANFLASPASQIEDRPARFASAYFNFQPLAPFDVAYDGGSAFYRQLARAPGRLRVIEAPLVDNRLLFLYRRHWLQHGQDVWIGTVQPRRRELEGPYVSLLQDGFAARSDADYLILHRDVAQEWLRYWTYALEEAWDGQTDRPFVEPFQAKAMTFMKIQPPLPRGLEARLVKRLGPPVFRDADVTVWDLRIVQAG